ncbi:hypothetical protein [Rhizobium sp. S163]|uniref:hypothetical protein n=1 Tax=Rhizobium sp. S163 TaxID=3055039 RepID=UPI0025A93B8A|nr:hypothetical protein [Rhizobium sp. S163]MDM9644522.1 hypothetical protein [Rhizobium sp. S163]
MADTYVDRKIHFARDFDERVLRSFEARLKGLGPGIFTISTNFKNGFTVKVSSVTDFIALPMTDADRIIRLAISFAEDPATAISAGRSPIGADIRITDEIGYSVVNYEIRGEYAACVTLRHDLDTIFRSTRAYCRSILHLHMAVDLLMSVIVLPVFLFLYVVDWPSNGFYVLQILTAIAYASLKTFVFPRLQLKWGYGAKAAARRSLVVGALAGFFILGTLGAIYQDAVLSWWKSAPKPPVQ